MKKIVGILVAAAIATSVFAADVSAKVQLEGNLFKFGTDKKITMFDIAKPSDQAWNPIINASVNNDQAGADLGTVNAILVAKDTFKDLKFGAGYANNFSGINMFVNVLGYMSNNKFNKVRAEIYAEGNVDAFSWKLFPVVEFYVDADPTNAGSKINVPLWARVDYKLDACGIYVQIEDPQGLTKIASDKNVNPWDDGFIAKLGLTGNIGGASWDVAAKLHLKSKVEFSVPVVLSMAW